jgi:predicted alpha/beta superfamily hydrolase
MVHAGLLDDAGSALPAPRQVGSLDHYPEIRSRFLPHSHDIVVCVPPQYAFEPDRRFPVLYLHDGQNVFDDYPMSPFGVQWGVDTTARALMHADVIEPVILVAIGNAGRDRIDEYTPTRDNAHDAGGMADRYGQMMVYEIKPFHRQALPYAAQCARYRAGWQFAGRFAHAAPWSHAPGDLRQTGSALAVGLVG